MKPTIGGLICAVALGLVAYGAQAASEAEKQHKADYDAAVARADADAKAALKSRDAMTTAREDKMEAEYKVAKERCDSLSGDAKEACVKDAKARYHQ